MYQKRTPELDVLRGLNVSTVIRLYERRGELLFTVFQRLDGVLQLVENRQAKGSCVL